MPDYPDHDDFERAATMPHFDRRAHMDAEDVELLCKRIDCLCGTWDDEAIADLYGVELDLVVAIRRRRDIDIMTRTDVVPLVAKLAQATGASADWILGWTDEVVRRTP